MPRKRNDGQNRQCPAEAGVIIVASPLLFPTALTLYGGFAMIFAAKQAVENWAYQRTQKQLKAERERIMRVLEERGMPLTPEQAKALAGEGNNR